MAGLGRYGADLVADERVSVAVVGDRVGSFAPQDSIEMALRHSGGVLGADVDVVWLPTPSLQHGADEQLHGFDAVWCAPGGPFVSLEGALEGIRVAREGRRPFLGTCAGFQHGVIEFARNVLGAKDAHHAEYGAVSSATLFIDELLCSLVGTAMTVRLIDEPTRDLYGADEALEQYYCRFGLNEAHTAALAAAGLVAAGVDATDGTTRIMRLVDHPFFYLTLFVPQTPSTPDAPHPIVTQYLQAAALGQGRGSVSQETSTT